MMERDLWAANEAAVDTAARAGCIKLARACLISAALIVIGCAIWAGASL